MNTNTIEDYVVYDSAVPIPAMTELTVKFSMRSNDKGLQAHYGSILSYGECGIWPSHHAGVSGSRGDLSWYFHGYR